MSDQIDFAIVTALLVEREAVLKQLDAYQVVQVENDPLTYFRGYVTLPSTGERYEVIVIMLMGMGNNESAIATTRLIERWHPASVIMLGIGAGVPSEAALGDIVVADFVYYYELAKRTVDGEVRRGQQLPCDRLLFDRARAYRATDWCQSIDLTRPDGQPIDTVPPRVRFGPIASGEKVVADATTLDELRRECPKLAALAMEGAGVARAAAVAYDRPRFLEVRGVSDYASPDKDDRWHDFAVQAAAAYLIGLLRTRPMRPINVTLEPTKTAPAPQAKPVVETSNVTALPLDKPRLIRTPDQRLRVFVSSTLQEVAEERKVARAAIEDLHLAPVMFELGARPHPPKDLYRAYLEQSHIFIGIYWQKYGWVAPDMTVSGLEDEWLLSGDRPKLIYIKGPAPERDPRLNDMLDRIRNDDRVSYKPFSTPEELRELIENDLMLMLSERFELALAGVEPSPTKPEPAPPPHNLPGQLSAFIGREKALADVKRLLAASRLVTLSGSGGVGKTRLSLQVAADVLSDFPNGVWFVELATLTDPALVPQTVATVLGLREDTNRSMTKALTDFLHAKKVLLLLDNCEHVIEAVARLVSELLKTCPDVRIIASSREALSVQGEATFHVPSLVVPDPAHLPPLTQLAQIEAVRLFVDRATASQPSFTLTDRNAAAVVNICQRLDGIPLAIELAAARIKVLSAEQIADRLDDRFRLLTGGGRGVLPRQQTLRALIDWSYSLLADEERRLFARLAAFVSGWTLDAAEAIGAGDEIEVYEVLDLLTRLVDKSLVYTEEHAGEMRYRRLETIRQYALEKLRESGEEDVIRARHFEYYLKLAEQAEPHLTDHEQQIWLDRLEIEHHNLRFALEWATQTRQPAAVKLAGLLGRFWDIRSHFAEARKLLNQVLKLEDKVEPTWRAAALRWAGYLAARQGDHAYAQVLLTDSLTASRTIDDRAGLAEALNLGGYIAYSQAEFEQALAWLREALELNRALNNTSGVAQSLHQLATVAWLQGDAETARRQFEESLHIRRELGDRAGVGRSLYNLGGIADSQGDYVAARRYLEESLVITREMGDRKVLAYTLAGLGELASSQGDYESARHSFDEGLSVARELADRVGMAYALEGLGNAACAERDYAAARRHLEESVRLRHEAGDREGIHDSLQALARVLLAEGQPDRATRLLATVHAQRQAIGLALLEADQRDYDQVVTDAKAQLSPDVFETAWAEGQVLPLERALDLALQP